MRLSARLTAAAAVAVAIGLTAGAVPQVVRNLRAMTDNLAAVAELPSERHALFSQAGAGEFVLPESIQVALFLLRRAEVADFRMTPAWMQSSTLAQRLSEGAYPIPRRDDSHILVGRIEDVMSGCDVIASMAVPRDPTYVVAYGRCP